MSKHPIPVTIITGFLGAGKTTLLNEILNQEPSTKFLIIENEAGEINIDGELLKKENKNSIYELTNGCICCSLSTELGTLLNSIILSNVNYDYMLIEATGMADPSQVVDTFSGPRVQRYFKLDGVVSLVDAAQFLKHIDTYSEIRKQVAQSDIVLINKTDLVVPAQITEIEQQLNTINPLARTENISFGKVDANGILNCELFHPSNVEKSISDFSKLTLVPKGEHAHKIQTLSFTINDNFEMEKLSWWLDNFLAANVGNILRIKGVLKIAGMKHKIILQSVGDNYHISQGSLWNESALGQSRLVFIGSNLDKEELQKNLSSLITKTNKVEI